MGAYKILAQESLPPWKITPHQDIFDEIIQAAKDEWMKHDNQFGYVNEKLLRVNSIKNRENEAVTALNMFHPTLRHKIVGDLSELAQEYVEMNTEPW